MLSNDSTVSGVLSVASVGVQGGAQAGTTLSGRVITTDLGAFTISSDGSFSFRANGPATQALAEGIVASSVFTYVASNGGGTGAIQTITVNVTGVNDAPIAVNDSGFTVTEDATSNVVTGNVLTNDFDPDGNATLFVTSAGAASAGNPTQGQFGTLVANADGSFTYTLNNAMQALRSLDTGQTLDDVFRYRISDGSRTGEGELRITVNGADETVSGPSLVTIGISRGVVAIFAPEPSRSFGTSIASVQPGGANDVTGDGRADLVVGSLGGSTSNPGGRVHVFSGASLTAAPVRTLTGTGVGDRFGADVAIGQIGGDGRADILVGAPGITDGNANAGRVYAFFGDGVVNAAVPALNGASGFTLTIPNAEGIGVFPSSGDVGPSLGAGVAILNDVNGDGRSDFFVAAPGLNVGGVQDVGDSYVGFGQASYPATSSLVTSLEAPGTGYQLISEQAVKAEGFKVAASGNVNGAGGNDLVLANARRGEVAVRLDNPTPAGNQTDNSDLTGPNGFRLISNEVSARFGESVAVGDINNDGRADLIVGAPAAAGGAGKVYILLGAANFATGTIDIAAPGAGVTVIEIAGTGRFGSSVAFVGDFNGDGRGDFVVGAPSDGATGSAYIITGSASPSAARFDLATSGNVIKVTGSDRTNFGREVAGPGDLDGDGLADVAIGSDEKVFVVYGRSVQFSASVAIEPLGLDDREDVMFGGRFADGTPVMEVFAPIEPLPSAELLF